MQKSYFFTLILKIHRLKRDFLLKHKKNKNNKKNFLYKNKIDICI